MKNKIRKIVFNLMRRIILKYFKDGVEMIEGSGPMKGQPIAWKWTFIDEDWEKIKYMDTYENRNKI